MYKIIYLFYFIQWENSLSKKQKKLIIKMMLQDKKNSEIASKIKKSFQTIKRSIERLRTTGEVNRKHGCS